MTQNEAREMLKEIMEYPKFEMCQECTGNAETCPIEECFLCAVRDCPGNEPLHYHHDGCPYCEFGVTARNE